MAQRPKRPRPGRRLVLLFVLIAALAGSLVAGIQATKGDDDPASFAPKLALDLQGGTQLILTPTATDDSEVTPEDVEQAIEIIRQRVDASGVSEAEITSQGGSNIVVSLPGTPSEETLDLVRQSAQLRFRPVLTIAGPGTIDPAALEAAQSGEEPTAEPTEEATEPPTPEEIDAAARQAADTDGNGELSTEPAAEPTSASDLSWITERLSYEFYRLDCTDPANLAGGVQDDPAAPLVSCAQDGSSKFILGPAEIEGTNVTSASAGIGVNSQGMSTGQWVVSLEMDREGTAALGGLTERLLGLQSPQNQFAIVLDGLVVSNAVVQNAIYDGRAQISGSFDQETANALANQLNFGSLPLNFEVQSEDQISATLGSEQLARGVLAGLIGAALVVLYMLWQYRGLGLVAVASLVISAALTYLVIALLSWTLDYRLSLPGVVGLIVAVGVTADSFIVYFERVRDEVREGRVLEAAVEHGWTRAIRTIMASDAVNFLAAVVLYFLAVGGVQGFAFTLGLTTIIDLVVVVLFTHPLMQLLVRTKFFGQGHRLSGLDPAHLGASSMTYRGRGRFGPARPVRPVAEEPEPELVGAGVKGGATAKAAAAGSDAAQSGTAGAGAAGSDAAGTGTAEPGRAGSATAGSGAAGSGTQRATAHAGATAAAEPAANTTAPRARRRPAPERAPLPAPAVGEDGRRLTIAERRAAERAAARQREEEARAGMQATGATESGDAAPAGEATPSAQATPSGEAAPSAQAAPSGDAAPTTEATPAGQTTPSADPRPGGEPRDDTGRATTGGER
ncbi:protein translocase subunit SecD [Georgenia sp. AZ-5]|uniref:protein translocase subunit SecD n=1 Tax=Georgenia sp. AZ-5 TaxID=3367526 RepID=UPI0037547161